MTIVQDRSTQLRTLRWGIVGTGRISDSYKELQAEHEIDVVYVATLFALTAR